MRSTIRRRRGSGSGIARWRVLMYFGSAVCGAVLTYLPCRSVSTRRPSRSVVYSGSSVVIGSAVRTAPPCWATCSAPPVIRATPAAVAESFAAASLSDMDSPRKCDSSAQVAGQRTCSGANVHLSLWWRRRCGGNAVNHLGKPRMAGIARQSLLLSGPVPFRHRKRRENQPRDTDRLTGERPHLPSPNMPVWLSVGPLGGVMPRCSQPASLSTRPRAVRASRPSWMR